MSLATADTLRRLLRIQHLLETHDQHRDECSCEFCQAQDEVLLLHLELRSAELREQRSVVA